MEEDLVIRGSLEESALPELLRSICKNKESGILTCYMNEFQKSIYLHEGQMIFATSTDFDDRLGQSLLRYGKITVRSFLDATKNVRLERRLGSILCDWGVITAEELVEGVRTQVRDIILGLFCVDQGPYELVLKEIATQEMILLHESTEDIIFSGVKSIRSWSRISKGMGSFTSKLIPAESAEKTILNLTLASEESHLFSLCQKGHFNVEEICGMSYLSNYDTCRTLWAFQMVGVLELLEPAEKIEDSGEHAISAEDAESDLHDLVENYNDLYSHIYDYAFERLGAETETFASKAMFQVESAMPTIARNLRLDTYGRLDFDAILKNLSVIPEGGKMDVVAGALEEIVYALLFEVGIQIGTDDQKRLTYEIQRMRKR